MKKTVMMLALGLVAAAPVVAQTAPQLPAKVDTAAAKAGTYTVDTAHTQIMFVINHFGFNNYFGIFGGTTGTLTIDPANPAKAAVAVEIPIAQVATTSDKLTAHLQRADFFDAEKFPTAKFTSTSVAVTGNEAKITGDLTLKGVTKPVVLDAKISGVGDNPMNKKSTLGFHASGTIKRSDFGITTAIPMVGDEVKLKITVAFEKQG